MKKVLILCALLGVVCAVNAQQAVVIPNAKLQNYFKNYRLFLADSAAIRQKLMEQFKQQPVDNMPVANVPVVQLTYKFNNGKGQDVYQTNIDNMYVLKPDSTFYAAMPVDDKKATSK